MLLLQFSTSHYCRKARLALGYKQIPYRVENLTPGVHALRVRSLTGTTTLPVLLPELDGQPLDGQPKAIGDSTKIFEFLETYQSEPSLIPQEPELRAEMWTLEDWLDESIGIATRFVYYDYRAGEGKALDPSLSSQLVIQTVRWQYGITPARVQLAVERLDHALEFLGMRWKGRWLVGDSSTGELRSNRFTAADMAAAALLSPLARVPQYRENYPWLFEQIAAVHALCKEPLPPGLE